MSQGASVSQSRIRQVYDWVFGSGVAFALVAIVSASLIKSTFYTIMVCLTAGYLMGTVKKTYDVGKG